MQPLGENTVNTPAFLGKLWKMVNDPSTDHLICWSPSGNSFIIQNQAQFWYELLPLYYKHNNMSSFVRQLNMYGFHKMSTVENGTMDADKDEIQFTHPYFQKDQPELLRNIKRKATPSKSSIENSSKHDELAKVLTDVKQLRGRQASVDSQLNAMKQENALLWREVAILRQKHLKQQKIVNKLIQFLVTLVQPSRMTVGVKRGYQLMLHESPTKKSKVDINKGNNNTEGPTIHELDNELELSPNLYEEDTPLVDSPTASMASPQQNEVSPPLSSALLNEGNCDSSSRAYWDKPEFVDIGEAHDFLDNADIVEDNLINTLENEALNPQLEQNTPTTTTETTTNVNDKVFLNPTTQDTLLSNLIKKNGSSKDKTDKENIDKDDLSQALDKFSSPPQTSSDSNMAIATRDQNLVDIIKSEDLSNHVEATQSELDQFKDILNNYNSYVDANALLGELNKIPLNFSQVNLFHDASPPTYDLNNDDKHENFIDSGADPLVSGSELTPYSTNFDFTELFDDAMDGEATTNNTTTPKDDASSTVNTPQIIKDQPVFPTFEKSEKK